HRPHHRPVAGARPAHGAIHPLHRVERGGPEEETMRPGPPRPAQDGMTTRRAERGSALVMAIFVLVLLTAMGAALLFVSENEMKTGQVDLRSKTVFYTSEAGLEDGRETLRVVNLSGVTAALRAGLNDELTSAAGPNGLIN